MNTLDSRSSSGPRTTLRVFGVLGAMFVSVSAILGGVSWHAHTSAIAQAETSSRNLVVTLEQHAARTIEAADLSLKIVQGLLETASIAATNDQTVSTKLLDELNKSSPQVRSMYITDSRGAIRQSSGSMNSQSRLSLLEYEAFSTHYSPSSQNLYIGIVNPGDLSNLHSIVLSRRLSNHDGTFAGAIIALIDPSYFRRFYEQIDVGSAGSVTLVTDSADILIRKPWREAQIGSSVSTSPLFREHLRVSEKGIYHHASVIDGVTRIFAYQRLHGLPLIAVTGVSKEEVLVPWRHQTAILTAMAILAFLFLAWLSALLTRSLARQERTRALFRLVFESSTDALLVVERRRDGTFLIETFNETAQQTAGIAEATGPDRSLRRMMPATGAQAFEAELTQCLEKGQPTRSQTCQAFGGPSQLFEAIYIPIPSSGHGLPRVFVTVRDVSHLKAAEEQLQRANKQLVLAEQIARVGHWRVELPSQTLTWSDEIYRIYGLDRESFRPTVEEAIAMYHPDDQKAVEHAVSEALRTGNGFDFSLRIVRSDFSVRDVVSRGLCELNSEGEPTAIFGTLMDVTDLRGAQRAVAESEARYRLLADHATDMIVLADLDTTRRYVSPASQELLGFRPEELTGTRPVDGVHPDDLSQYEAFLQGFVQGADDIGSSRQRYRRKDGTFVWTEATFRLMRNADGQPTGYVASVRDISYRHAAEVALSESEARYRLLADNVSDLIILGRSDGRRIYISPAVQSMLGFTVEEAHRIGMRDWLHPDDLPRVFATTAGLTRDRPTASIVYRLKHKAGHYIWAEAAFRQVDIGGETTIITAIRDVTERHQQAEALQSAKDAAESAQRQSELANQAKTDFLATMSHEIRTPLNGVLGYTDLLLDDSTLGSQQRRHLERIQASGAALLTVVNDILDFSKVEAGQIELEYEPFSLRALVDNTVSITRGLAEKKGLVLSTTIGAGLLDRFVGDQNRLRQVLLNLLNNAVKFTTHGSVSIAVEKPNAGDSAQLLRFSVTDTGIGIPQDKLHRLFERFSQVDPSIRREFGGTGLGLAISKQLIELMGGRIGVESHEGQGTTFWFELTLSSVVEVSTAADPLQEESPRHRQARAKILLVEDLDINQELVRAVLAQAGHEVDVVSDGADAVMAVQAYRYDLVLMDVQMPGMDGLTATRRIRALPAEYAAVPIVAMTANVLPHQVTEIRAAGMNAHVGKPFKRPELLKAVDQWARKADGAAEFMSPPPQSPVLDRSAYTELAEILGEPKMEELLRSLRERLLEWSRTLTREKTPDLIARDAHIVVSAAGMLGFVQLSNLCSALETVCLDGSDMSALVEQVLAANQLALDEIASVRQAA